MRVSIAQYSIIPKTLLSPYLGPLKILSDALRALCIYETKIKILLESK